MLLTRKEWTKKNLPLAIQVTKDSKVFPETLLVQAILESQKQVNGIYYPGQSKLATEANNFFGIKASNNYNGDFIVMRTREVINGKNVYIDAKFRAYDTDKEGFKDYVSFLENNKRYKAALEANNAKEQLKLIAQAGYATDPNYANVSTNILSNLFSSGVKVVKNNPLKTLILLSTTALIINSLTSGKSS